jgi:hypothetical protein
MRASAGIAHGRLIFWLIVQTDRLAEKREAAHAARVRGIICGTGIKKRKSAAVESDPGRSG